MARYFLFSSAAFLVLMLAAIYDDSHPQWKAFQERFHALRLQKLRSKLDETTRAFDAPGMKARRRDLQAALDEALRGAEGATDSPARRGLLEERRRLARESEGSRDRYQRAQAVLQGLEREHALAPESGRPALREKILEQRRRILASSEDSGRLERGLSALDERIRGPREPMEKAAKELEQFLRPLRELETKLDRARKEAPRVVQILNERLGVVDRCASCHLGHSEPEFRDSPRPLNYHASLLEAHRVDKFGCTPCHGGNGRATTARDAHGHAAGGSPLLHMDVIESSCAPCHRQPRVPGAPSLTLGRRLFLEAGCLGCHAHQAYGKPPKIGPALAHVGSKVRYPWLKKWLKNPTDYLPRTRMPNFSLGESEIEAIGAFLMTQTDKALRPAGKAAGNYDTGERMFKESQCVSCHAVNGKGGTMGPDLGKVAEKLTPEYLIEFLRDPRRFQPLTRMPRYRFSQEELQGLAEYISTEFRDFEAPSAPREERPLRSEALLKEGVRLIRHYGCYGCHDIPGIAGAEVGAELTDIGLKRKEQLDYGLTPAPAQQRGLGHWLDLKLKEPRAFRDTLKMPRYDFTEAERRALVTLLLSFTDKKVPQEFQSPLKREEPGLVLAAGFGELVADLNCLSCHSMRGRGGTLAPDLSWEGSQVQPRWLVSFLRNPDTIRLNLVERMPKFRLSESEATALAGHIQMFLADDSISRLTRSYPSWKGDPSEGKRLYAQRGCSACHQLGAEGGSIGPELTHVGGRLTSGWIFSWLKDPRRYRPDTMEPNHGLSDAEASALAAFLSGLR